MRGQKTTREERERGGVAMRYRILKAVTLEDGRTAMPGDTVSDTDWPYGRAALLIDQRYMLPIEEGNTNAE